MEHMTQQDREAVDQHAGHKIFDALASHDRHAGHSVAMFRDKFWLSFALTIPVVFVYGGLVFIRGAWRELADHKPGMMTLISLAIIVAFGTSVAATFGLFEINVWWELSSLITIMLLGHWLEMRAISQAHVSTHTFGASIELRPGEMTFAKIGRFVNVLHRPNEESSLARSQLFRHAISGLVAPSQ